MATSAVAFNPAVTGGAPIAGSGVGVIAESAAAGDSAGDNTIDITAGGGVIIDGAGETAKTPLQVLNAKNLSGVEIKETGGTANTGLFLYNNSDSLQARFAFTKVGGGIIGPSTVSGDLVITGVAGITMRAESGLLRVLCADNTVGWSAATGSGVSSNVRVQGFKGANVASAASMTLGAGNYFVITGTTNIDTIVATSWQAGAEIVLQFDGILTLNPSGAGNVKTTAGVGLITSANDIVRFVFDGTSWWQSTNIVPHA